MKNNDIARLALIVIAAVVFILLINSYNNNNVNVNNGNNLNSGNNNRNVSNVETFYADGEEDVVDSPLVGANNESDAEEEEDEVEVNASEGEGDENVTFRNVPENQPQPQNNNNESGRLPSECYPKDTLTPQDLLPQDSNSTWAQTVPAGQGSLGDQNFLNAGFHVGINTVGQSLRNANLQLRSEPANPQMKVSPWLQSTIDPDINRKALEIGA